MLRQNKNIQNYKNNINYVGRVKISKQAQNYFRDNNKLRNY